MFYLNLSKIAMPIKCTEPWFHESSYLFQAIYMTIAVGGMMFKLESNFVY